MAHAHVLSRLRAFFVPDAFVPEEEERHKEATKIREMRAAELRKKLQTDPALESKIDSVTSVLLRGVQKK